MAKMIAIYNIVELLLVVQLLMRSGVRVGVDALAMDYYIMRCPMAELIIKNTVNQALSNDPTLAAGLLRMHFHDCFVEVCMYIYIFRFLLITLDKR